MIFNGRSNIFILNFTIQQLKIDVFSLIHKMKLNLYFVLIKPRKTKYKEHIIKINQPLPLFKISKSSSKRTSDLFFSSSSEDMAELQSRLLLPFASLLLGFIAIPVSYCAPKKGRYTKIFLGASLYFLYFVVMSVAKKMYILEYTPNFFGIWWIHIFAVSFLIYLYHSDSTSIRDRD